MALVCRETEKEFDRKKKDYVVMHPIAKVGFAVSGTIVEAIPPRETYADPCRRYGEGLNVCAVEGSIGKVHPGGYFDVTIPGQFKFGIMRETAQKHLPKTLELIDRAAERRRDN